MDTTGAKGRAAARPVVVATLVVVLVLLLGLSIAVGARPLAPAEAWRGLVAPASASGDTAQLVRGLRLPRTLLGLVAGLALGAAGALTRGHTRNPMADPGLLGVSAGAALSVVTTTFLLGVSNPIALMMAGLAGAAVGSTIVFVVAARGRSGDALTLVVAGTGVSAALTALTSAIVLLDSNSLDTWRTWSVGSLSGRDTGVLVACVPFVVAGLALALHDSRMLSVLELGDDAAAGLGIPVGRARATGLLAVALLVGAATAACGPIAFLGLVVTALARRLVGTEYRWIVPVAAGGSGDPRAARGLLFGSVTSYTTGTGTSVPLCEQSLRTSLSAYRRR